MCACGAALSTWEERSIKQDPYSLVWMDNEGMSEGMSECARCADLRAGARRRPRRRKIIEKAGS